MVKTSCSAPTKCRGGRVQPWPKLSITLTTKTISLACPYACRYRIFIVSTIVALSRVESKLVPFAPVMNSSSNRVAVAAPSELSKIGQALHVKSQAQVTPLISVSANKSSSSVDKSPLTLINNLALVVNSVPVFSGSVKNLSNKIKLIAYAY